MILQHETEQQQKRDTTKMCRLGWKNTSPIQSNSLLSQFRVSSIEYDADHKHHNSSTNTIGHICKIGEFCV